MNLQGLFYLLGKLKDEKLKSILVQLYLQGKIQVVKRKTKKGEVWYIRKTPKYYSLENLDEAPIRKILHTIAFTKFNVLKTFGKEGVGTTLEGRLVPKPAEIVQKEFPKFYEKEIEPYKRELEQEERRKKIERLVQIIERATGRKFIGEERKKLERELEVLVRETSA